MLKGDIVMATTEFEDVLMKRDRLRKDEAMAERRRARKELYDILENGGDYGDVEEMLLDEFGLEMDYIFDLM